MISCSSAIIEVCGISMHPAGLAWQSLQRKGSLAGIALLLLLLVLGCSAAAPGEGGKEVSVYFIQLAAAHFTNWCGYHVAWRVTVVNEVLHIIFELTVTGFCREVKQPNPGC
jgi:hypothetical protein